MLRVYQFRHDRTVIDLVTRSLQLPAGDEKREIASLRIFSFRPSDRAKIARPDGRGGPVKHTSRTCHLDAPRVWA